MNYLTVDAHKHESIHSGATFSTPAFSTPAFLAPAFLTVPSFPLPRSQSPLWHPYIHSSQWLRTLLAN